MTMGRSLIMEGLKRILAEMDIELSASRLNVDTHWIGEDFDPLRKRIQQASGKDFGSLTVIPRFVFEEGSTTLIIYIRCSGLGRMGVEEFIEKAEPELMKMFTRIDGRKSRNNYVEWMFKFNL